MTIVERVAQAPADQTIELRGQEFEDACRHADRWPMVTPRDPAVVGLRIEPDPSAKNPGGRAWYWLYE